ncbi:MAG: serine hydrolase [Ignavibacteriae bacterium]|nr:serine hydrolase [Ignavibacteriota bacterium]
MNIRRAILVSLFLLFTQSFSQLSGFDSFVEKELTAWKVPGAAIAIIKDGKVILMKGYGFADVNNKRPVTTKTAFPIASVTKSFTVSTLAVLAKQGKLDWKTPVREYLPDFRLYDETLTAHITPRDLVTHRSGLPRHDMAWYNSSLPREELYQRLRYLEPSEDIRTAYQYNNFMFMTAGYLAGKLSGGTWEQAVAKYILTPVGMSSTTFTIADLKKLPDYSLPYQKDDNDEVKEIGFQQLDAMGPTGSINSNVEDMVKYVAMHLNNGKHADKEILLSSDVEQMRTPQMVIHSAMRYPELGHTQYGMGFVITTYRGHKLVHHAGNMDGFASLVSMMPRENIGIVILTNLDGNPLRMIFSYNIYDRFLGLNQIGWSKRFMDAEAKDKATEDDAKKQGLTAKRPGTRPSHTIDEYAGEYEHPAYGAVAIESAGGDSLRMTFHDFKTALHHFHYDVFETPQNKLNRLERTKVMFNSDWDGEVSSLSISMQSGVKDIVFARVPEKVMKSREFLQPLAGQYDLGSSVVSVMLRDDNVLVMSIPGQSPYELLPVRGAKFNLKGMSGYSVEFKRNQSGVVTDVAFYQPDGNYVAKRR